MTTDVAPASRRNWVVVVALLLSMWSCYRAETALDVAERAEDQSDAAEGEAERAKRTAEQAESDIEDIKYRLRMP